MTRERFRLSRNMHGRNEKVEGLKNVFLEL